ncbi:Methyltransferase FkbM [Candidatus Nanopelagicaceae bacterium]
MISAGVGEDISFDLEFQALTGALIVLVDPTPAAINHFNQIKGIAGRNKIEEYSQSSRQKPEAYSLFNVDLTKVEYLAKALWSEVTALPFFEPKDMSRDGSFSLNSIHTFYAKETEAIMVETITISEIMRQKGLLLLDVLKLDIEGAALEVLEDCFAKGIFPGQLLLEVDEIHFPSLKSKLRARKLFRLLKKYKYEPIARDNCDFLFLWTDNRD